MSGTRPIRMLMLSADFAPGSWSGIGVAVSRHARALARLGVEVHVAVAGPSRSGVPQTPSNLHVHDLPRGRFPIDPRGFDCIHVHSLRLADLAIEIARRFRLPLVATVHGWPHVERPADPAAAEWSLVQRRLLLSCTRVVVLSRAERELALSLLPEIAARTSIAGHGVPAPVPSQAAHDRRSGPIVFAGRFSASKGIHLLTETAARLLETGRVRVVLAGGHGDGPGSAAVAHLAARFPSTCRVTGWLEAGRLDALFGTASMVLVPSAYEPFGLVALEAMRMGAPVLASGLGGLREIVAADSGGCQLDSRDPRVWADAVSDLLDSPGTADALSRRGPVHAAARYSDGAAARRLLEDVYEPAVQESRFARFRASTRHRESSTVCTAPRQATA